VIEAAGFTRFSVLGYSFTGAFAPWLAHLTDRVDAVVSGGFPIAGDYSPLYPEVQYRAQAAMSDPAAWSNLTSLTLFLETDDCRAAYDELSERGVVFNDPPTLQAYGIDTSFRDPSGNNIRLTQVLEFDPDRH